MLHSVKTTPNTLLFVKIKNRQIIAKEVIKDADKIFPGQKIRLPKGL